MKHRYAAACGGTVELMTGVRVGNKEMRMPHSCRTSHADTPERDHHKERRRFTAGPHPSAWAILAAKPLGGRPRGGGMGGAGFCLFCLSRVTFLDFKQPPPGLG